MGRGDSITMEVLKHLRLLFLPVENISMFMRDAKCQRYEMDFFFFVQLKAFGDGEGIN